MSKKQLNNIVTDRKDIFLYLVVNTIQSFYTNQILGLGYDMT